MGGLASSFGISSDVIMNLLYKTFPSSAVSIFEPIIMGKSITSSMIVFYISAFLLASNGTHSMIISSNQIYKFENKDEKAIAVQFKEIMKK